MGELTASESGIAVVHEDCTKNTEYPFIFGSPLHVRQIFVNILTNAIKYNKPGGRVYAKIECYVAKEEELMDIMMTVMDGYEATRQIRKSDKEDSDIPIIALTANSFFEDAMKCKNSGIDEVLTKPVNIVELVKTISFLVNNKQKNRWYNYEKNNDDENGKG